MIFLYDVSLFMLCNDCIAHFCCTYDQGGILGSTVFEREFGGGMKGGALDCVFRCCCSRFGLIQGPMTII